MICTPEKGNEIDEWGRSTHRVLYPKQKGDSHCEKIYLKHVCNIRTHIDSGAVCNYSSSVNQLIGLKKSGTWVEVPVEGSLWEDSIKRQGVKARGDRIFHLGENPECLNTELT